MIAIATMPEVMRFAPPAGVSSMFFYKPSSSPPTVTSLSASVGPDYGGKSIVITGTNFTGATAVTFNGVNASSFVVNSSTQITATTAAGTASTTAGSVVVTTAAGSGTLTSAWIYYSPFVNPAGAVFGYRYENASVTSGKVTSWTDQIGTNHAVQATTANQPLYTASAVASHAALQYSGGQILVSTNNASVRNDRTVMVTFQASGTAGMVYEQSGNASANPGSWIYSTTGWTITNRNSGGAQSSYDKTANWATDSTWRSCIHVCDGTHAGHVLYINGTAQSLTAVNSGAPGTGTVTDKFYIGARFGVALPMTGYICDLLAFNGALGASDITNSDEWLRGRVGL